MPASTLEGARKEVASVDAVIGFRAKPSAINPSGPTAASLRSIAAACGDPAFLAMSRVLPVINMDLRGQIARGSRLATDDASAFELPKFMADFDAVSGAVNADRFILIGYSHAGYFTTRYALENADRVRSLVLIEPALFLEPADLNRRADLAESADGVAGIEEMLVFTTPQLTPGERRTLAEQIPRDWHSNKAIANEFRVRAQNPITEDELSALQMPVLLIGGTESNVSFQVERAATAIPRAQVWWVRGANHLSLVSDRFSQQIAAVVRLFVSNA